MNFCKLFFLLFTFASSAYAQLHNETVSNLKNGKIKTDSSYIYTLPYPPGKKHLLVQGYNGRLSHKNEWSLDFMMKRGSRICAARDGVVQEMREDSQTGGLKYKYLFEGNYIIILHSDSSTAWYWHLKKDGVLVNRGDTVKAGQLIGYSGNSGYTAFPHLHFQVIDKNGKDCATRFNTKKGIRYLQPLIYYRNKR